MVDTYIANANYFISLRWYVSDVQEVRPDLSVEQCIELLNRMRDNHDANVGVSWETIDAVAEMLYPVENGSRGNAGG